MHFIGPFQDTATFDTVWCRQMKILKRARFGVSNSQGTKDTETAIERFSAEMLFLQYSSSQNLVNIFE